MADAPETTINIDPQGDFYPSGGGPSHTDPQEHRAREDHTRALERSTEAQKALADAIREQTRQAAQARVEGPFRGPGGQAISGGQARAMGMDPATLTPMGFRGPGGRFTTAQRAEESIAQSQERLEKERLWGEALSMTGRHPSPAPRVGGVEQELGQLAGREEGRWTPGRGQFERAASWRGAFQQAATHEEEWKEEPTPQRMRGINPVTGRVSRAQTREQFESRGTRPDTVTGDSTSDWEHEEPVITGWREGQSIPGEIPSTQRRRGGEGPTEQQRRNRELAGAVASGLANVFPGGGGALGGIARAGVAALGVGAAGWASAIGIPVAGLVANTAYQLSPSVEGFFKGREPFRQARTSEKAKEYISQQLRGYESLELYDILDDKSRQQLEDLGVQREEGRTRDLFGGLPKDIEEKRRRNIEGLRSQSPELQIPKVEQDIRRTYETREQWRKEGQAEISGVEQELVTVRRQQRDAREELKKFPESTHLKDWINEYQREIDALERRVASLRQDLANDIDRATRELETYQRDLENLKRETRPEDRPIDPEGGDLPKARDVRPWLDPEEMGSLGTLGILGASLRARGINTYRPLRMQDKHRRFHRPPTKEEIAHDKAIWTMEGPETRPNYGSPEPDTVGGPMTPAESQVPTTQPADIPPITEPERVSKAQRALDKYEEYRERLPEDKTQWSDYQNKRHQELFDDARRRYLEESPPATQPSTQPSAGSTLQDLQDWVQFKGIPEERLESAETPNIVYWPHPVYTPLA